MKIEIEHEGSCFRCSGNAELTTRIDPIISQAELAATPEHFLDVDRIGSTPDLQHLDWPSLVRSRYEAASGPDVSAAVTREACPPARKVDESPELLQAARPRLPLARRRLRHSDAQSVRTHH